MIAARERELRKEFYGGEMKKWFEKHGTKIPSRSTVKRLKKKCDDYIDEIKQAEALCGSL